MSSNLLKISMDFYGLVNTFPFWLGWLAQAVWQFYLPPAVAFQGLAAYAVSSELGSSLGRLAWGSMVALRNKQKKEIEIVYTPEN